MSLFLVFFLCFFLFQFPLLATEVTPSNLPYGWNTNSIPGYCILKYDVLTATDDVYTCTYLNTVPFPISDASAPAYADAIYSHCWWSSHGANYNMTHHGIILKKQVFASFTLPEDYQNSCKLKSQSEPDQICNQSLNVNTLVRSSFSQRFPLDLFENFNPPSGVLSCPSFTITGQTFQLCYLNDLVASLKYVLLVVFIITSVMSL